MSTIDFLKVKVFDPFVISEECAKEPQDDKVYYDNLSGEYFYFGSYGVSQFLWLANDWGSPIKYPNRQNLQELIQPEDLKMEEMSSILQVEAEEKISVYDTNKNIMSLVYLLEIKKRVNNYIDAKCDYIVIDWDTGEILSQERYIDLTLTHHQDCRYYYISAPTQADNNKCPKCATEMEMVTMWRKCPNCWYCPDSF